ncbi:MAG TPA: hypothetical protein VHV77_15345 [Pirellulales bacterium]|jgi:hypothetical protein|nr:hypothetical protein [Pirellulales bacterium]
MSGQLPPRDAAAFVDDRDALLASLGNRRPDVTLAYRAFNPYPWEVEADELTTLERLSRCLRRAARAFVENYLVDDRLRRIVALEPRIEAWLRVALDRPYSLGAIRPDFLHASDGTLTVNEINARFPLNGFLVSEVLSRAIAEVPYRSRLTKAFEPIAGLVGISAALERLVRTRESALVIKGVEHGYDIRLLMDLWHLGDSARPADVTLAELQGRFAMLELHQHELLNEMSGETMSALARDGGHLNDLRTIFLVHDKRLLAVMTGDILRDYLDGDDVDLLHRHVAATYVVGLDETTRKEASEHPSDWVLKPHLLGKAEGIVLGSQVPADAWRGAIDASDPRWVLQRFVSQRTFPIISEIDGEVAVRPMHVIGLLPSLDEEFFGPGIYRAGLGPIVNVAGGGTILAPVVSQSALAARRS